MKVDGYRDLLKSFQASCRVRAKKALGSSTIIYSQNGDTYALTNFHVIESSLSYKEGWDSLLQRDVKKEYTEAVDVEFPKVEINKITGHTKIQADIVLHHKEQDLALLKLRSSDKFNPSRWYDRNKAKDGIILSSLACIGAALGGDPIITFGNLNGTGQEIDNYEYWMSTAPSIFGNSGGGLFILTKEGEWDFFGIPSRISVQPLGFSAQAITHMGYFIPLYRIYDWLEENCYQFLFNDEYTKEQCDKAREEKKKESLNQMMRR